MLLRNCKYIVTQNKKRSILEGHDLLIEGNVIKKIAKGIKYSGKIVDCSKKIVMPGLINTHTHIGMHSLRGICDDEELPNWLDKVIAAEKKFSKKDIEKNASMACKEMLASGTTTFLEMYYPLDPVYNAVKKSGLRAQLYAAIYGGLGNEEEQFRQFESLLKECRKKSGKGKNALVTLGLGPHSVYTCSESMLKRIKKFADKEKLRVSIHIAETRKERFDVLEKTGSLPVQYLEKIKFLDKNILLVHAVWLTKGEVRIIGKHKASVAHCPISNMKLSSGGVTPLMEMFDAKVAVGLGTDSVASNNNMDMFEEMKIAGLLHKHHRWNPKVATVQEILDMATLGGAKILDMEKKVGSLEVGKLADVITIKVTDNLWPLDASTVLSHLVYSCSGRDVSDVFVNGVKLK